MNKLTCFYCFQQVRLYIDGKLFVETQENPDIVDDWPLHNSKVTFTRFMVGACWQGKLSIILVFTLHVPVIYWPCRHNVGDIELRFFRNLYTPN